MKLSSINISYLIWYVYVQSIISAGNEKLRHLLLLLLLFLLPCFWNLVLGAHFLLRAHVSMDRLHFER